MINISNKIQIKQVFYRRIGGNMRIGELKEIIKNVDDDEEILITMPELKYIHHVKEIKINPLNTENDIIEGVVIIGYKYS